MLSVGTLVLLLSQMTRFNVQAGSSNCQDQPLGMENGNIPDERITSSPAKNDHPAKNGRVNKLSVFCPSSEVGPYLQIDLGTLHEVCAVGTQGYHSGLHDYPKTYQVDYSLNGAKWYEYKENGVTKVFDGNVDHLNVKKNPLPEIKTRYIRIRLLTWHVYPCFRAELYGRTYPLPEGGNTFFAPFGRDHALSGHVIKTTVAVDAIFCLWDCLISDPQCKSFNYNHVTTSCELNSATKEESPGEFVKRDGFTYYVAKENVEIISF